MNFKHSCFSSHAYTSWSRGLSCFLPLSIHVFFTICKHLNHKEFLCKGWPEKSDPTTWWPCHCGIVAILHWATGIQENPLDSKHSPSERWEVMWRSWKEHSRKRKKLFKEVRIHIFSYLWFSNCVSKCLIAWPAYYPLPINQFRSVT